MEIKQARCTSCGAPLEVSEYKQTVQCNFCKNTVIVEQAKALGQVELDKSKDLAKLRENLKEAVKHNSIDEILRTSALLRDIIPDDFSANYFFAYAKQERNQPQFMYDFLKSESAYTKDDYERVINHIIKRSDLRDKPRIVSFIRRTEEKYLYTYEKQFKARIDLEDHYAVIPRDVFVCFSSFDVELVKTVVKQLERDGNTCWVSYRNLRPDDADNYWHNIEEAIDHCSAFLVVSSEHSMRSKDVQHEISLAIEKQKTMIEFKVDDSVHSTYFKHAFDGLKWVKGTADLDQNYAPLLQRVYETLHPYKLEKSRSFMKRFLALIGFIFVITAGYVGYQALDLSDSLSNTDQTPPVITLNGESNLTIEAGSVYEEQGAIVTDNYDETINYQVEGAVNTSVAGTYELIYKAVDQAGNETSKTRTVTVEDTVPPTAMLVYGDLIYTELNTPFIEPGLVIEDNSEGTFDTIITGEMDTSVEGTYTLEYRAVDPSGNESEPLIRTVVVIDATFPLIVPNDGYDMTINYGQNYEETGAKIYFPSSRVEEVTTINNATFSTLSLGEEVVTYTYEHLEQTYTASKTVQIIDALGPNISLNGESTMNFYVGETYEEQGANAVDNHDGTMDVVIDNSELNMDLPGTYTISYTATDTFGNITESVRTIYVMYHEPMITFDTTVNKNSMSITVMIDDIDGVLNTPTLYVYDESDAIIYNGVVTDGGTYDITGLLSGHNYQVEILDSYYLGGQYGEIVDGQLLGNQITTETYTIPTVLITHIKEGFDQISYDIDISDPDGLAIISRTTIYDGDEVVQTINASQDTFTGLLSNHDYIIEIEYQYDLLDGAGMQTNVLTKNITTSPYINIASASFLNQDYFINDVLTMTLAMDNPNELSVRYVTINGTRFSASSTLENTVVIDVDVEELFEAGEHTLTVESINGTIDSESYDIALDYTLIQTLKVLEPPTVMGVKTTDALYNEIFYTNNGNTIYYELSLDNPSMFDLTSVTVEKSPYFMDSEEMIFDEMSITMSEDKQFAYVSVVVTDTQYDYAFIKGISYEGTDFEESSEGFSGTSGTIYGIFNMTRVIQNSELIEVSTYNDLLSMTSNYGYILTQDIDLSGVAVEPIAGFSGVLDGNGFTISNWTYTGDVYQNTDDIEVGLFGELNEAVITNLTLDDFLIDITLYDDNPYVTLGGNIGCLGGLGGFTKLYNVQTINANINVDSNLNMMVVVGGLVGSLHGYSIIEKSLSDVEISYTNSDDYAYIGGVVGDFNGDFGYGFISETASSGSIVATGEKMRIGGISGGFDSGTLNNAYSTMDLTTDVIGNQLIVGGLVGQITQAKISNVYTNQLLYASSSRGLFFTIVDSTLSNAFSFSYSESGSEPTIIGSSSQVIYDDVYSLTYGSYSMVKTQQEILNIVSELFDDTIWDFNDLTEPPTFQ
jgi:predicted RNA-binding Zn-ribbon protein involved in translation (DUF1610 family)